MERILSLAKKKAEEAEVFSVSAEETPVLFETNRLKQLQTRESQIIALRIVRKGRIGFSLTTQRDDAAALVSRAAEVAEFGAEARLELPATNSSANVPVYDPQVESTRVEQMVELGEAVIQQVRQHTPDLVCDGSITRGLLSIHLWNSRGGEATYRKSICQVVLNGTLIRDTDMLFVGDSDSSCHPIYDATWIAHSMIEQLDLARNIATAPAGELPVIFTPRGVASAFYAPLAVAFNGRIVWQGVSPLGKRRGELVFDQKFHLQDDATLPFCPRSRPCDDEGVPSRRIVLVDQGRVQDFLYDLQTAGLAGTRSTGSGSRVNGGLPMPSPSALVIGEGNASWEEMVKDIKLGLIVDQLMGAEQTNVLGGEFGGNVLLGYKVENGEVVGRVKDTMVSGNIYQILREIVALGKERRWIAGGMLHTPAIYCPRLTVGRSQSHYSGTGK